MTYSLYLHVWLDLLGMVFLDEINSDSNFLNVCKCPVELQAQLTNSDSWYFQKVAKLPFKQKSALRLLESQTRSGDKNLEVGAICPQNGTAVLKDQVSQPVRLGDVYTIYPEKNSGPLPTSPPHSISSWTSFVSYCLFLWVLVRCLVGFGFCCDSLSI